MNFAHSQISIDGLIIQNEDHLSQLSIGTNVSIKRAVAGKKNQGFGQQISDQTTIFAPIFAVIDDDESDFPSSKSIW